MKAGALTGNDKAKPLLLKKAELEAEQDALAPFDMSRASLFRARLADVDDARALLSSLRGVKHVDRSEGRWIIHADRDVRVPLHDAVTAAGGRFTHLSRDRADLDAIYHRYFGQPDGGGMQ